MVDALVLSGGSLEREKFPGMDRELGCKARVPILGRPMVEWVIEGLRSCARIDRIVVVGNRELDTPALRELGAVVMPERGKIAANLRVGLRALPGSERVLALSGDLPLVRREALEDLLENAPAADLVYPYIERGDILQAFPERDWLFAWTPDGVFTGSSAALFQPETLRANWRWVEEILEARRKKPLELARMVGPACALRYICHRLSVAAVERRLSAQLRLTGRGYRTRFTELTMDVDRSSDLPLVERVLRRRGEWTQ
jgi:molybdopterin-guanine dinucleotide biosynthesis protein A